MVKIRIILGGYGLKENGVNKLKDRNSEPFFVDDTEAHRLIANGMAEKVEEVAPPKNNNDDIRGACINQSDDLETAEGSVGHLSDEQLQAMTNKELKRLAEDMGIDTSKMRVKKDYISAITAVDVEIAEDGDEPPTIETEDPVE